MASRIKIRSQRLETHTEIKLLLSHPMENGRNRDALTGALIPAHFIQDLVITLNGKVILSGELGGSLSKDPFFSVRLKQAKAGDTLNVQWRDNQGQSDQAEHILE